ncbi:MAG TPA: RusA family crossover junction endodeoxyribonuclease [Oligoflexus sp.]|uniref:RusA family crossover junction endodeoxyribonuclease n=1 Tax=Oligoflexus sp. TaxID=1971216 RepID=UPI002D3BFAAF|nr:RusA family crossover junction endodeoxyribonuclease [Oligoflexus sp.]HYX35807.1 RusA family crossover junction endodeoxyribonuclease [Oligoflexus sp.]
MFHFEIPRLVRAGGAMTITSTNWRIEVLLNFTIPIEPQGKKVPRITRNGNFKDPETRAAMEAIADAVRRQYQGEPLDGPLRILITAWRTRPKAKPNAVWADTKPDYDNVEKLIGDALEGILWVNDSRIVDGRCLKKYAPKDVRGWIEIEVELLDLRAG